MTRYNDAAGAAFKAATPGLLWPDEAPQDQNYPLAIYTVVSTFNEWTQGGKEFWVVLMQFAVHDSADSPLACDTAAGLGAALYNDALLTLTTYTTIRADLGGQRRFRDSSENRWESIWTIRYMLEA